MPERNVQHEPVVNPGAGWKLGFVLALVLGGPFVLWGVSWLLSLNWL